MVIFLPQPLLHAIEVRTSISDKLIWLGENIALDKLTKTVLPFLASALRQIRNIPVTGHDIFKAHEGNTKFFLLLA